METHRAETKELSRDALFELANHSYLHPHMRRLTDRQIRREIQETQDVMLELTGRRARLFRAPYGECDGRVLRVAESLGLKTIQWDVVSGDPDRNVSAERMTAAIMGRARNGSIVVMHINGRGRHTAEALPMIVGRLRKAGYRLVTVSAMLRSLPAQDPNQQVLRFSIRGTNPGGELGCRSGVPALAHCSPRASGGCEL
jgi:peptidoglycan/xylan/chitin deacetylase (PgdA/CDA1 family)